jgi:hypothetical protein
MGIVTLGEARFAGMRTASGTNFWPWMRTSNQITKGAEENIADYHSELLKK